MRLIDADNIIYPIDASYKASVKRIIEQQPTIEVPIWIPCSERLPEVITEDICKLSDFINFKDNNNKFYYGRYNYNFKKWYGEGYNRYDYNYVVDDVIAWQPIE